VSKTIPDIFVIVCLE